MSMTALCSVTTVMMWLPFSRYMWAAPLIARLSDSVAPLVKTISFAVAPISAATCLRATSTASSACQPNAVVAARGVAEAIGEIRHHRLERPRVERRRGVVVHVDRKCQHRLSYPAWGAATGCGTADGGRDDGGFRGHLGHGARRERRDDPLADLPERVADVARRKLPAALVVGGAGGHGQRAVNRLDDISDRNGLRIPGQLVAAAGPLLGREQPPPRQPLQHLRHQLDRESSIVPRFRGRSPNPVPHGGPGVSWRSTRNRPSSTASAWGLP